MLVCLAALLPVQSSWANDEAEQANQARTNDLPVTVWTDFETYAIDEDILVSGTLNNYNPNYDLTIIIRMLDGNIVEIRQVVLYGDVFDETFATTDWKTGTYEVTAQNGQPHRSDSTMFEISKTAEPRPERPPGEYPPEFLEGLHPDDNMPDPVLQQPLDEEFTFPVNVCLEEELCLTGTITNAVLNTVNVDPENNSIEFVIQTERAGELVLEITPEILDGVFLVEIDGEISEYDQFDNIYTIPIEADAESVVLTGTHVIPEFPIVMLLLVGAMAGGIILGNRMIPGMQIVRI